MTNTGVEAEEYKSPLSKLRAVTTYEGKDYTISAGENFRFDKNGLHSVTADERFKMGLLLVLE